MLLLSLMLAAAPVHFESGDRQVALVELYTSEGCSSCPPADRWLAGLRTAKGLWRDFVPIAFHVNYWDRLGWKDRMSTPAFTRREYAYSAEWGSSSVYTPCFVRDGKEFHPRFDPPRPESAQVGDLSLTADTGELKEVKVTFRPLRDAGRKWTAHVALLAGGVSNRVSAGENAGSTLTHEFVAVALAEGELASSATLTLPPALVATAPRHALVAWITASGSPVPLQATGGWVN